MVDGHRAETVRPDVAGRMREIRDKVRAGKVKLPPASQIPPVAVNRPPARRAVAGVADGQTNTVGLAAGRPDASFQAEMATLRNRTRDAAAQARFREFTFPSAVPIIGPLISAFRRAWNGISTKWYVSDAMHRQTQFNYATSDTLNGLLRVLADHQSANAELRANLDAQRSDLDALRAERDIVRSELQALRSELREARPAAAPQNEESVGLSDPLKGAQIDGKALGTSI